MNIHKVTKMWEGMVGELKVFPFGISMGEWDKNGAFRKETCELLVVRGTTSFCNNRITILTVGESAMWNVQMWWNEQCWRGTISFSAVSLTVRSF